MAEPDQRPSYDEQLQQLRLTEQVLARRAEELQQFMLSFRRFRTQEQLILLLIGAVTGISIYKLWAGL
jgi:hypothetical protein